MRKHILIIPSWYPNSYNNLSGIFFKEQAEALAKENKVGVIAILPIGLKLIIKLKKLDFSYKFYVDQGIFSHIVQYAHIIKNYKLAEVIRLSLFKYVLKKYIEMHGVPDIVHLHSFEAGELALWVKETYNIPYVVTEHSSAFARGLITSDQDRLCQKLFSNSSCNIAVSQQFVDLLQEKFHCPFIYIPNIVSAEFATNTFAKKSKELTFDFINIGFLDKNKNQEMLIKAFYRAFEQMSHVRLTIVGDGAEYSNLKNLIDTLGLVNRVTLFGRADRQQVHELLNNSDAFVLSSQYETFGVVVIEAMMCGLPVISTRCGGPESIITEEKLGLLVNIDEEDLACGMKKIYDNRAIVERAYIVKYTKDNFSKVVVIKKLNQLYNAILVKNNE